MNKSFCVAALAALMVMGIAGGVMADDGMYGKLGMKYTMPSDPTIHEQGIDASASIDNGMGFLGAIGYGKNSVRVEFEIATQKNDFDGIDIPNFGGVNVDSGDVRVTTYMVNGYYDIDMNDKFGVYGTGGIGYGDVDATIYGESEDDGGLAWKIGAGVFYNATDDITVDVGYEYLNVDDADFDGNVDDIESHNIVAAVRYSF